MSKSGIFVSYARVDGEGFATSLRQRLEAEARDLPVWQDRPEIEGGVGWWRQIEEALERVEFLIIVMTPAVMRSEITRREWRTARQNGVCVFPVKGPNFSFEDVRLPGWMKRVHIYDLDQQWETFLGHLRRGCQATRVPFMAPPLPAGFVARKRESEKIRSMLLDPATGEVLPTTAALAGAGGFGKTTLAAALCHDEDVITAFDDGILWTTLGQTPNVQGELTRLYAALVGERPGFINVEDAAQALAEKLEHKRCLIVIDDVWDLAHLRPFLRGGAQCARLVTTRQARVAAECDDVSVDEMTSQEATSLLRARIDAAAPDLQPFRKLAHRLGEWPLLLKLANAALRGRLERGDTLERAVRYVERALDKHGVTAFDRDRPSERSDAVASTLAVSLDLLDPADQSRCAELAIFPEDVPVPVAVLEELWAIDDLEAEEVLSRMHDASLIEFDLGAGVVHVHDIMLACLGVRLGSQRRETHARLLAAWPDLRNLPHLYAWRWLGHHLAAAGRAAELRALLLDLDWLQRKLQATDIYALLADFAHLADDHEIQLLQKVLRLSSHVLAKDKSQLAAQLLGRVPDPDRDLRMQFRKYLGARDVPWIRPTTASLVGPGGALVRTFDCGGVPSAIAVTSDGERVILGSADGAISVWEISSGALVRTLRVAPVDESAITLPEGSGTTFVLMPDGRLLLAGGRGLSLWDPTGDAEPQLIVRISDAVGSLAVSADGRRALHGTRKGVLTLFDLGRGAALAQLVSPRLDTDTGEPIAQHVAHRLGITAAAISGDGRTGLTGSYDKTVRVWDLEGYRLIDTLYPPHEGVVYAVAAAREGRVAVSGSGDRSIRIWDLESMTSVGTLTGHRHRVYDLALTRDGSKALSASHDRTVRLWDLSSKTALATLHGHSDSVLAVAFTPDERSAVSAARDGTIRLWQLDASETRPSTQAHEGWIQAVALDPTGAIAVTGGQDAPRVRLWDFASGRVARVLGGHRDAVSAVALHRSGRIAVTGSYDCTVIVWNLAEGHPIHTLTGHADAVASIAISADGTRALSGGSDGDLILWNIDRGRIERRVLAHRRGVTFVAVPADWRVAVTGSLDGTVKVWDLASFECIGTERAHLDGVSAGAVSADGELLLTGGPDGTLRLWRFPSCEFVRSADAHADRVRSLCFAGDGRTAFSSSYDRYIKAWAIPQLEVLSAFAADSAVAAIAVSDAGDRIVAGDAQGCAHFLRFDRS